MTEIPAVGLSVPGDLTASGDARMSHRVSLLQGLIDVDLDVIVLSDPGSVAWVTEAPPQVEIGHLPWTAGTFVVVTADGVTIISDQNERGLFAHLTSARLVTYSDFDHGGFLDPTTAAQHALRNTFGSLNNSRVGIEPASDRLVRDHASTTLSLRDITTDVQRLRAVKDAHELAAIRYATELVNVGQRAVRAAAEPGRREIDVWGDVHAAMCTHAGERVPVVVDLMSGERCMTIGTPPTRNVLQRNELVLCDLAPRRGAYWADSCTTFCLGTPSTDMRRAYDASHRCLDAAIAGCRAGRNAGDLDHEVRTLMESMGYTYPHHTGHGVGLSYHEAPRIVPGSTMTLEVGMVLALEPGAYANGIGVRLEHLVYVGPHGPEVLTDIPLTLEQYS
jgi:Xaa-Pro dipeptidase